MILIFVFIAISFGYTEDTKDYSKYINYYLEFQNTTNAEQLAMSSKFEYSSDAYRTLSDIMSTDDKIVYYLFRMIIIYNELPPNCRQKIYLQIYASLYTALEHFKNSVWLIGLSMKYQNPSLPLLFEYNKYLSKVMGLVSMIEQNQNDLGSSYPE